MTSIDIWIARARGFAVGIAAQRGRVTIDDVREVCPPPAGADPRIMGNVFKGGAFELAGHEPSKRKECHRRPVAVYRLAGGNPTRAHAIRTLIEQLDAAAVMQNPTNFAFHIVTRWPEIREALKIAAESTEGAKP